MCQATLAIKPTHPAWTGIEAISSSISSLYWLLGNSVMIILDVINEKYY